jgi:AraC-like DNA-binding protein
MLPTPEHLCETHLIGPRCREWVLGSESFPQLRTAGLVWVGHSVLRPPYRMVRLHSEHSHVVAAFGGRGRTMIDGRVVEWRPGQVLLAPAGAMHAFEVAGTGAWRTAWVFFDDAKGPPVVPGNRTRLVGAEAGDFVATMQMLAREAAGTAQPAVLQALATLLETHARRLAGSDPLDARLWRLWEQVESDLGRDWNGRELARLASLSEEHLRRLCHRHLRRSPMAHLAHLRLQRAGTLLRSTPAKIEDIAVRVGFAGVYSFSAAFKRWSGVPPSEYRSREASSGVNESNRA